MTYKQKGSLTACTCVQYWAILIVVAVLGQNIEWGRELQELTDTKSQ